MKVNSEALSCSLDLCVWVHDVGNSVRQTNLHPWQGESFPNNLKTKSRPGCRVFLCLFGRKWWDLPLTPWLRSRNPLTHLFSIFLAHHHVPGAVLGTDSYDNEKRELKGLMS